MTEFYKVLYDYETTQKDELSVKEGEILRITNRENADWWIAERMTQSNSFGLVPSNFLESVQLGIVTKDYEAQDGDQLNLKKEEKVIILEKDDVWMKGQLNGKIGIFPSHHVEEYSAERSKNGFKLAAYGVKQGGIGSILAGRLSKKSKENEIEEPKIPSRPSKKIESKAMVLHDYTAESEDEIGLMRGEYITVLEQPEGSGWWKGSNERDQVGVFPSNFVQIVEQPPIRPTRTRPPTVKSEDNQAAPPPVPVGTRPSSLLTNRPTSPLTSPPPRPVTSPPSRSLSISTHKRTPSIPVVSPDLPPLSPVHTRQVIPRPTSSIDNAMNNMAKPPKISFTPKLPSTPSGPVAPPRPLSRPTSIQEPHPPIPKRSMPAPPPAAIPPAAIPPADVPPAAVPPTAASSATATNASSPTTDKIEKMIEMELDKLRQEFEIRLQEEKKRLQELIYSHQQ